MRGDIIYLELALKEVGPTLELYREVFHWKITQSYLSKQLYYIFETSSGCLQGGFDANLEPSTSGALIYLQVEDIDQVLSEIQHNYSKVKLILGKTFLSKEYGSYALILDPSGNRIGIYESNVHKK